MTEGDGRRWVEPYFFTFSSYAKRRWHDRRLLDVLCEEFPVFSEKYYRQAISTGRVMINHKTVSVEYVIGNGDFLEHRTHLHEPSVLNEPIEIIADTEDYIVINKPASMPTHKGGLYQKNSALEITQEMLKSTLEGTHKLSTIHRLDRVVSGILIFSKDKDFSKTFSSLLQSDSIKKIYIARVHGKFNREIVDCNESLGRVGCKWKCCVDKEGKSAKTKFQFLSYSKDLDESIVLCHPLTGRQHQIRVHLAHLGFPIVLDRVYSPTHFDQPLVIPKYPGQYQLDPLCPYCQGDEDLIGDHSEAKWDQIYLHSFSYTICGDLFECFFCTSLPHWVCHDSFLPKLHKKSILESQKIY